MAGNRHDEGASGNEEHRDGTENMRNNSTVKSGSKNCGQESEVKGKRRLVNEGQDNREWHGASWSAPAYVAIRPATANVFRRSNALPAYPLRKTVLGYKSTGCRAILRDIYDMKPKFSPRGECQQALFEALGSLEFEVNPVALRWWLR